MIKVNQLTQAKLIEALLDGVYSCAELAERTGLHYVTVCNYTKELHRIKAAHICHWDTDSRGRQLLKIYKLGRGTDAKRTKMTRAERQTRYRNKQKQLKQIQLFAGQGARL